jgi:hypothetical protein
LWHAQADSFACATPCDDFATASAVGIPVFIIRLTPALGRDGPSCDPFRALPRRTATLSGFCDVTLDFGLFERNVRRRRCGDRIDYAPVMPS